MHLTGSLLMWQAQRLSVTSKCQLCAASLNKAPDGIYAEREKLVDIKDRHSLVKQFDSLFKLVFTIENCVLETVKNSAFEHPLLKGLLSMRFDFPHSLHVILCEFCLFVFWRYLIEKWKFFSSVFCIPLLKLTASYL